MQLNEILEKELERINPREQEKIWLETKKLSKILKKALEKKKIKAEIFIGGSLAKGTLIRKEKYDIDIFLRFHNDKDASDLLESALKAAKLKAERIHGSRNYFQLQNKKIIFELIPILKINFPEQAKNITDLSALHVSYILKKIKKNKKIADEIKIAKSFSYAQGCYGAESYIHGFSGYALEVLVSHYKSFVNFLKAVAKLKQGEKLIIDPEKHHGKKNIMQELNEAKLMSPIIAVDPVHKERNITAALSQETFERFSKAAKEFLAHPSTKFFEVQKVNPAELKKEAGRRKAEFILLGARTNRQRGDIACAKLRKFFEFLAFQLGKNFSILKKEVEFQEDKAEYFFILKQKKEIIIQGPPITAVENLSAFKKRHKNCFIKQGKAYAKEKTLPLNAWFARFKTDYKKTMVDMGITEIKRN